MTTPSAVTMATTDDPKTSAKDKASQVVKPERPDEEKYKTDLAKAEKELNASNERMVRSSPARGSQQDASADCECACKSNDNHRKRSRPSSTTHRRTKTHLPPSASKSSAPSWAPSAHSSNPASLPAARSWTRLSVWMSS